MTRTRLGTAVIAVWLFLQPANALAQDDTLAKQAQNPVASLISVPFQNNTNFDVGPEGGTQNVLNIQPVIPFNLGGVNLITRTILPVISQPAFTPGGSSTFGLGDTALSAFLSPAAPGGLVWGIGPQLLIPTATSDVLGADRWGAGPSVVVLTMPGKWVVGSLFSQVWSFAGSGTTDLSLFTWQYFINYNLPNQWYLTSAPIMTADWEASDGQQWTVPVGAGAGKVFAIGAQPINGSVSAYYNVEKPDNGPEWQLRLQLQLLFPK